MAFIPIRWEWIRNPKLAVDHGGPPKARKFGRLRKLARPLRSTLHRREAELAAQEKDKTMENETTNLFRRRDTFFGICEAVGQDFGFNPLWLRLAFVAPLFFFPVQTFIGYFALGGIVLASRLLFPVRTGAAAAPTLIAVEGAAPTTEKADEFALAA